MTSLPFGLSWPFLFNLLTIVVIDLVLSGDNAVVIALAAKTLPHELRLRAYLAGAGSAVAIRIITTFFAAQLLHVRFVQLLGGILVFWISVSLFRESSGGHKQTGKTHLYTFWKAMWYILAADVTMSTDNVLAVAAAAHGSTVLLVFGLLLSIPLVMFSSTLLANLMEKYPLAIYLGAALLGRVAGDMIMTDSFILRTFAPRPIVQHSVEALSALAVLVVGWLLGKRHARKEAGE